MWVLLISSLYLIKHLSAISLRGTTGTINFFGSKNVLHNSLLIQCLISKTVLLLTLDFHNESMSVSIVCRASYAVLFTPMVFVDGTMGLLLEPQLVFGEVAPIFAALSRF